MTLAGQKRKHGQTSHKHPSVYHALQVPTSLTHLSRSYLSGNFAPINQNLPLTPCPFEGPIPFELASGQYLRNGGNPVSNEDLGRDAHWFDGDGMLSGVWFKDVDGIIQPQFVNQYILTDLYLSTLSSVRLKTPILPSIATLVNPASSLIAIVLRILRSILLVVLSFLPGSRQVIRKISVANTAVLYHDGRALATCESGPPMRISLPGLETVGWYDGIRAEGEPEGQIQDEKRIGGDGLLGFVREWTTAHPKVDPCTKEMFLFHSSFAPPYVQYSVIPETGSSLRDTHLEKNTMESTSGKLVNQAVPGISSAKMMHDFGVSRTHTVIMDLPLSLDPLRLAKNRPVVEYDASKQSRFGVFPRQRPDLVSWFETSACCIFHTANTWDEIDDSDAVRSVHMLACRLTSSNLVFSAGNIAAPQPTRKTIKGVQKSMPFFSRYEANTQPSGQRSDCKDPSSPNTSPYERADDLESTPLLRESLLRRPTAEVAEDGSADRPSVEQELDWEEWVDAEEDQCRLYYYNFSKESGIITSQFALSALPFEFPSIRPDLEMQHARYIYGCSTSTSSFGAALGRSVKIDVLVKMDAHALIETGQSMLVKGDLQPVTGCVDQRLLAEITASRRPDDPIQAFVMPDGWYAQEPRFVPRTESKSEDDGYLLTYAFDESQLDSDGEVPADTDAVRKSKSELWIIDAKDMKTIVSKVKLPQRVPYGLHGAWIGKDQIKGQRAIETIRTTEQALSKRNDNGLWMAIRASMERLIH